MPAKLLSVVSPDEITRCATGAECMQARRRFRPCYTPCPCDTSLALATPPSQVLQRFPPGHKGVVLWLLDLMADVADLQEFNKMNERAVAIVMAPNLYDAKTSRGKSRRRPCLAADGDAPPVPPAPAAQAARCWSRKKQPRACRGHSRTAPLLASQAPTSPW